MNSRIVIKLGGSLLDNKDSRARLATELAAAAAISPGIVVVHGGGKQMTRFLAERGVENRFVNGLRVSTPEVIDAVLKVFAGTVNHELVASLVAAGASAVGLSGIDCALLEAAPLGGEYGAVGRPVRTNPRILEVLCENGFLPVVACIGGDRAGNVYNVNGDQMAAACAAGFGAQRLLFLTDVDGVRDADGAVLGQLAIDQMDDLIRTGVASGGMQAKLEAAKSALRGGVQEVSIAAGALVGIVGDFLRGNHPGTRLITNNSNS